MPFEQQSTLPRRSRRQEARNRKSVAIEDAVLQIHLQSALAMDENGAHGTESNKGGLEVWRGR